MLRTIQFIVCHLHIMYIFSFYNFTFLVDNPEIDVDEMYTVKNDKNKADFLH